MDIVGRPRVLSSTRTCTRGAREETPGERKNKRLDAREQSEGKRKKERRIEKKEGWNVTTEINRRRKAREESR